MDNMHLTEKYRPKTLDDILGQDKIVSIIKKMINTNHIMSFLMFGSPATGKTSIGGAIANDAGIPICFLNAVNLTKKDLENASKNSTKDSPVIIYVDEIHRLTTPNQEFFLPLIEEGSVILIGATTESVYHKITKALRSRMAIFELNDPTKEVKESVLSKIIKGENIKITDEAKSYLTSLEDIRVMINSLEFALSVAGEKEIEEDDVKLLGRNHIEGDNQGNYHYSMKAAYQKSVRGSNLDAALYYLSRMLKSGDLESAIRRLRIIAFEDIGLGDVEAVTFAEHAINVAENVGLPEATIPMALATARLCLAQKDNSVNTAMHLAMELPDYKPPENINQECPPNYIYPHNFENHIVAQQYMPKEIENMSFFEGSNKLPNSWQNIYENIKSIIDKY